MSYKVCLSPSNQPENVYAYGNTNESEQCGKIAEACRIALERCGFEVIVPHKYSLAQKCAMSDKFKADLHVPIHTNAFDGKVSGTRIFCYKFGANGHKACKAIFDALAPITPGKSESVKESPKLYEIRVPKASTAYIEVDFHDNETAAKWIIENTTLIGETIAKGICNYFGVTYKPTEVNVKPAPTTSFNPYLVRVKIPNLNIRKGAGVDKIATGNFTGIGVFTIVEEAQGKVDSSGSFGTWGKLKSGAGWICLAFPNYTEKV